MPNTKPGIIFDSNGLCSACFYSKKKKKINWKKRMLHLKKICDEVRNSNGNGYECIVPVSGGKDSTYQADLMKNKFKLKTLCINVCAHIQTEEGILNLNSMVKNVGVDLVKISIKPSTQKKIRRFALFELGNPNYAEHIAIFSGVARMALNTRAPLVVWGEDIAMEFGGNVDEKSQKEGSADNLINNDLFNNLSFEKFVRGRIKQKDLYFYNHPQKKDFKKINSRSIYLSYFNKWDGKKHFDVASKLGFVSRKKGPLSGNLLAYDNIDEKLCEIHIWFKMLKFGFWRPTDQCCYQIWNNRMDREKAVEFVRNNQYKFPHEYLKEFLEFHDLKKGELFDTMEKWRNKDIWVKKNRKWRLREEIK
jgi:N-acetyl sugar amidotransferase